MADPTPEEQARQNGWAQALSDLLHKFPNLAQTFLDHGMAIDPTQFNNEYDDVNRAPAFQAIYRMLETFEYVLRNNYDHANSLSDTIKGLHDQLRDFRHRAAIDRAVIEALKAAGNNSGTTIKSRRTGDPTSFKGEEEKLLERQLEYVAWKSQIKITFQQDAYFFPDHKDQLLHILSLLKGDAYDSNREHIDFAVSNSGSTASWEWSTAEALFKELDTQFEIVNIKAESIRSFDKLNQKKKDGKGYWPYPNFVSKFQTYANRAGKTKEQQVEALLKKVSDNIAQHFRTVINPPAIDDIKGWIKLGQQFWENQQVYEHNHPSQSQPTNKPDKQQKPQGPNPNIQQHQHQQPHPHTNNGGDAMDLDQMVLKRLSPEDRAYCVEHHLCFYCRKAGHGISNCANKDASNARRGRGGHAGSGSTRGGPGGYNSGYNGGYNGGNNGYNSGYNGGAGSFQGGTHGSTYSRGVSRVSARGGPARGGYMGHDGRGGNLRSFTDESSYHDAGSHYGGDDYGTDYGGYYNDAGQYSRYDDPFPGGPYTDYPTSESTNGAAPGSGKA